MLLLLFLQATPLLQDVDLYSQGNKVATIFRGVDVDFIWHDGYYKIILPIRMADAHRGLLLAAQKAIYTCSSDFFDRKQAPLRLAGMSYIDLPYQKSDQKIDLYIEGPLKTFVDACNLENFKSEQSFIFDAYIKDNIDALIDPTDAPLLSLQKLVVREASTLKEFKPWIDKFAESNYSNDQLSYPLLSFSFERKLGFPYYTNITLYFDRTTKKLLAIYTDNDQILDLQLPLYRIFFHSKTMHISKMAPESFQYWTEARYSRSGILVEDDTTYSLSVYLNDQNKELVKKRLAVIVRDIYEGDPGD